MMLRPGLAAAMAIAAFRCPAAEVILLPSGPEAPYREAGEAARKALAAKDVSIRWSTLEALENGDGEPGNPQPIFIAIGTRAASLAAARPGARVAYCMVSGPEVIAAARGAEVRGVSADVPIRRQVELIAGSLPMARRIGLLYRSDQPRSEALARGFETALPRDWKAVKVAVNDHPSHAAAIEALYGADPDLVWTAADGSIYDAATVRSLLLAGLRRRIPVFGFSAAFVRAGALVGVGIDPGVQGEQAAALVEAMMAPGVNRDGTGAGLAAPVEPRFKVIVNLIVAEKLSKEFPAKFLEKADEVIRPGGGP